MFINVQTIPVETISGMRGDGTKENEKREKFIYDNLSTIICSLTTPTQQ
jgi:hypothetical protein